MGQAQQAKLIASALRRILFQPKYVPYPANDPRRQEQRSGWQNGGEQDSGWKRGKFLIDEGD